MGEGNGVGLNQVKAFLQTSIAWSSRKIYSSFQGKVRVTQINFNNIHI